MQIYVGSTNPVKINAVTNAASETWPEVVVKGFTASSRVPEQPIGDGVTREGAQNRAQVMVERAQQAGIKTAFLAVGLEGGVFYDTAEVMWTTVWAAVRDLEKNLYVSNGARFQVPAIIAERIKNGEEMGPITAKIVGESDVRSKQGMIGVITEGFVDRTQEYTGITRLALGLWHGRYWQQNL